MATWGLIMTGISMLGMLLLAIASVTMDHAPSSDASLQPRTDGTSALKDAA
jgi:hypothetical protein